MNNSTRPCGRANPAPRLTRSGWAVLVIHLGLEHPRDSQAGIQIDEIRKFQRTCRVVCSEPPAEIIVATDSTLS